MITERGWPRPVVDGLPVPWVSNSDSLSMMEQERLTEVLYTRCCGICGETHDAEPAYMVVREPQESVMEPDTLIHSIDDSLLHGRCLLLALRHCPELRRLTESGTLQIVCTRVESVSLEDGRLQAVGRDCRSMSVAEFRDGH